jgi:cytochrome c peroxidase
LNNGLTILRRLTIGAFMLGASVCVAEEATTRVLAPGYGPLEFVPPAAGSYELPPLGRAADGAVIDMQGKAQRLASYVMKQLQLRLLESADFKDQVRMISLSFDPIMDTPSAMRDYSMHFRRKGFDWRFLTTKSESELQPILEGYGQYRQMFYNEDGSYSGTMSHILRVYLIDADRRIRNIYSAGFLHVETVLNDLRTLQMERAEEGALQANPG